MTFQQFAKESLGSASVASRLHEDVDQVAVLIDRTPEILSCTVDRHEDFVQIQRVAEPTLILSQSPRILGTELSVVSQVDFRGRYFVPAAGPGFRGAGVRASINPTIHSTSRSVSVTPAAIAGDIRNVLCTRQKL